MIGFFRNLKLMTSYDDIYLNDDQLFALNVQNGTFRHGQKDHAFTQTMKTGDKIGFLIDMCNGSIKIYKNGNDLGYVFENNAMLKNCEELFPTL